jgi:hypothetical protein
MDYIDLYQREVEVRDSKLRFANGISKPPLMKVEGFSAKSGLAGPMLCIPCWSSYALEKNIDNSYGLSAFIAVKSFTISSFRSRSSNYSKVIRRNSIWSRFKDSLFTQYTQPPLQSESFFYSPLVDNATDIRLITLFPRSRSRSGLIECSLEHTWLANKPTYAALSYTWGDVTEKISILINGRAHDVTKSLFTALQHLQHENEDLVLWVDSICINQDDHREKSVQVRRMAKIFSEAAIVLAWLGPGNDSTDRIMRKLTSVGQMLLSERKNCQCAEQWVRRGIGRLRVSDDDSAELPLSQLVMFTSLPFWSRLWIRQELGLASDMICICGRLDIDKETLSIAIIACFDIAHRAHQGNDPTLRRIAIELVERAGRNFSLFEGRPKAGGRLYVQDRANPYVKRQTNSMSLLEVLLNATLPGPPILQASDPCDMVYGLLGIANDINELGIEPDYSKSYKTVYQDVTETFLTRYGLDILSLTHSIDGQFGSKLDPDSVPGLPSWVHDWSRMIFPLPVSGGMSFPNQFEIARRKLFNASITPDGRRFSFKNEVLSLLGVYVDTIEHVWQRWSIGTSHSQNDVSISSASINFQILFRVFEQWDSLDFFEQSWQRSSQATRYSEDDAFFDSASVYFPMLFSVFEQWVHLGTRMYGFENGYWEALLCSLALDCENPEGRGELHSAPNSERRRWERPKDFEQLQNNLRFAQDLKSEPCTSYLSMVSMVQRPPYITSKGYVGVGALATQPGDIVVLFYGASVPFVLREAEDGQYQLLGDTYVHGIMDGELMRTDPPRRIFQLR